MKKYYRVKKDNFLWKEGAILKLDVDLSNSNTDGTDGGYRAIDDVWDNVELNGEYISKDIIEDNTDYFERVYKSKLEDMLFDTKEAVMEAYNRNFKKK